MCMTYCNHCSSLAAESSDHGGRAVAGGDPHYPILLAQCGVMGVLAVLDPIGLNIHHTWLGTCVGVYGGIAACMQQNLATMKVTSIPWGSGDGGG